MTAEVVIMNQTAIAIAADSAVTIQGRKVLNTANKLYMLAPGYAIGILIFNNAALMTIAWEIIIRQYRESLKAQGKRFARLQDCTSDFMQFVEDGCRQWLPPEMQMQFFTGLVQNLMEHQIFRQVGKAVKERILETAAPVAGREVIEIAHRVIDAICRDWESADWLSTPEKRGEIERTLSDTYYYVFEEIYETILGSLNLDQADKTRLWQHCIGWFTRKRWFNEQFSAIGFAGYGDDELYPAFELHYVESYLAGHLKSMQVLYRSAQSGIAIIPLAQDDIILTIISGIHPQGMKSLQERFEGQTTERYRELLADGNPTATPEELDRRANEMARNDYERLRSVMLEDLRRKYSSAILNIVQALPKDELALMAETLVNITSYIRRVSISLETVGGPTDVAVISRKDGYIWIKRKHYFDAEANYHFFQNLTDRVERKDE